MGQEEGHLGEAHLLGTGLSHSQSHFYSHAHTGCLSHSHSHVGLVLRHRVVCLACS
jgi:hypothetical protein